MFCICAQEGFADACWGGQGSRRGEGRAVFYLGLQSPGWFSGGWGLKPEGRILIYVKGVLVSL